MRRCRFPCRTEAISSLYRSFQARSKIYTSPRGSLPSSDLNDCDNKNLNQLWFESCDIHSSKVAFTDAHTGACLTYTQIGNLTRYTALILSRQGVSVNDVVCIFSPNTIIYGTWCHGILAHGAIVTPANPMYSVEELRRHLQVSKAKVVITLANTAFEKTAMEAVQELRNVSVVTMPLPSPSSAPIGSEDILSSFTATKTGRDDVIVLPFSSGTTGLPKGVQLTNRNIVTNCKQLSACLDLKPRHNYLNILPFYHIYGFTSCLQVPFLTGGHQVVMTKFDLHLYRESIPHYQISLLYIAPPIAVMLAKCPDLPKINTTSVEMILSGAAPLSEEVQQLLQPRFAKTKLLQGYGLTETSPVTHLTDINSNKNGSIGPLVHNTEARLVNAEGKDVEDGRQGEIWIRGPQVMKGYLRQEDTDAVFSEDGWFKTGDIARADSDGVFFITDRIKELVKYNGLQVPPAEIEGILFSQKCVKDCLVFGIPDVNYGELPTAHVVLETGVEPSAAVRDELYDSVKSKVANHKWLRGGIRFVQSIPKTPSGKLLRRTAREAEIKLKEAERAAKHSH